MEDVISALLPKALDTDQVLFEILEEVNIKAQLWEKDIANLDFTLKIRQLCHDLENSLTLMEDPAISAFIAFKLASEISRFAGPEALDDINQRHSAMRLEVSEIIQQLEAVGHKPRPALIWKELIRRCGQQGSCCINLENDPDRFFAGMCAAA